MCHPRKYNLNNHGETNTLMWREVNQLIVSLTCVLLLIKLKINGLQLGFQLVLVDLLIISVLIKEVALAFTTGTWGLTGAPASKVTNFPALPLSCMVIQVYTVRIHLQTSYTTSENKWNVVSPASCLWKFPTSPGKHLVRVTQNTLGIL